MKGCTPSCQLRTLLGRTLIHASRFSVGSFDNCWFSHSAVSKALSRLPTVYTLNHVADISGMHKASQ